MVFATGIGGMADKVSTTPTVQLVKVASDSKDSISITEVKHDDIA
jgi:hypothetical protein